MPKVALSKKTKLETKVQDTVQPIPIQFNYMLLR